MNIKSRIRHISKFRDGGRHVATWLVFLGLWLGNSIHAWATDPIVFHANQFFVNLDDDVLEDTLVEYLLDLNSTEVWHSGKLDMAIWEVTSFPFTTADGETILDIHNVIGAARRRSKIRSASLNVEHTVANNVAAVSASTCFDIADYQEPQGTASTIKISILDTGISPISDNSTTDYNFDLTSYTGYDYVHGDNDPEDEHGHGTHVTGLIHALTHTSFSSPSRIEFDIRKTHDHEGKAFLSTVVIALLEAIEDKADIVNMSFGYADLYHDSLFFPLQVVIQEALYRDVLIVIASGNDGIDNDLADTIALPASFPESNILSVASLNCVDQLSIFSNYGGASVDIGVMAELIDGPDLASGLVQYSGTSQAAAIITATAALIGTRLEEDFTPAQVICPILRTAEHVQDLTDQVKANGKLNFQASMNSMDSLCLVSNFDCDSLFTGAAQLSGSPIHGQMIESDHMIHSDQTIGLGIHQTYDARLGTELRPGFEVSSGSLLQILTTGCLD